MKEIALLNRRSYFSKNVSTERNTESGMTKAATSMANRLWDAIQSVEIVARSELISS